MSTSDYVELRCRSAFSFLEAASNPEDLIQRAAELEHPTLALGDRDGLYGTPRFHQAARAAGIRAIVGAEITLAPAETPRAGLGESVTDACEGAPAAEPEHGPTGAGTEGGDRLPQPGPAPTAE